MTFIPLPREGRKLVLGGVELPGERGLAGHSDADVLLHALADALLGAAALGDIGHLFPPGDPSIAGSIVASSSGWPRSRFGRRVTRLTTSTRPLSPSGKIAPYIEAMRTVIATDLGIAPNAIGLKATTNEQLGSIGRGEGIAVVAIATIIAGLPSASTRR